METVPRAALAELVGTFVFVTVGAGSVIVAFAGVDIQLGLLGIAAAHGLIYAIMVSVFRGISGGHLNPAVTFGIWSGGRIDGTRAGAYVAAQLGGALLAGIVLRLFFVRDEWEPANLGTPALTSGVGGGRGIFIEAILVFILLLTVWAAMDPRGERVGGFGIGMAVFVGTLVGWPLTGAALNPARHFGPALASGTWGRSWVYWLGPLSGAVLASILYRYAFWREGEAPATEAGGTQPRP